MQPAHDKANNSSVVGHSGDEVPAKGVVPIEVGLVNRAEENWGDDGMMVESIAATTVQKANSLAMYQLVRDALRSL